jgi:hypothetical protein
MLSCVTYHLGSDEAKLKREVVNEIARLTTSNDPVEVEHFTPCDVGCLLLICDLSNFPTFLLSHNSNFLRV